jgi:SAM-dependent methyltransferase
LGSIRTLTSRLASEIARTRDDPHRLLKLARKQTLLAFLYSFRGLPGGWRKAGQFQSRLFSSYEDYLKHQRSKPARGLNTPQHDRTFRSALAARLRRDGVVEKGVSVLCLGARFGTEVKAFHDLGSFAVGIDVRTGERNKFVLQGDFHNIQFPAATVDIVFTNSLDHAFDFEKVMQEIRRVLKPSGTLLVEAVRGSEEGHPPGGYEAFYWSRIQDLADRLESRGFTLVDRYGFEVPWGGDHLRFVMMESDASARSSLSEKTAPRTG